MMTLWRCRSCGGVASVGCPDCRGTGWKLDGEWIRHNDPHAVAAAVAERLAADEASDS